MTTTLMTKYNKLITMSAVVVVDNTLYAVGPGVRPIL